MTPIDPMVYLGMYIVSYALAWYTWKDEKEGVLTHHEDFFDRHHSHRFIDTVYLEGV